MKPDEFGRDVRAWIWFKRRWYLVALSAFVILGTLAFFKIGSLIDQVQKAQDTSNKLNCAITRAVTANPPHRIPSIQTQEEYDRQIAALNLIVSLSNDLDCNAVLARAISHLPKNQQKRLQPPASGGGGAQSPPQQGSQLPEGQRALQVSRSRTSPSP